MLNTFITEHAWARAFAFVALFIGLFMIVTRLGKFLYTVLKTLVLPAPSAAPYKGKEDFSTWAIVTGAAGGIGRSYCEEFAKRKFSLILIDVYEEGLKQLDAELKDRHPGIQTQLLPIDLSLTDGIWEVAVQAALRDKTVSVLVNNAGITVDPPGLLDQVDPTQLRKILDVNVRSMAILTQMAIPSLLKMSEGRGGKRGLVISMSSFTARTSVPMLQVYGASKKFVEHFTSALAAEYTGRIDFVTAAPWWVATPMTGIRRPNWRAISPAKFTAGVMKFIGSTNIPVDPYWIFSFFE